MIMRKMKRFLLVIIASVLVVAMAMIIPAGAATTSNGNVEVLDQELVFCELNSIGNIQNIRVVDWLSLSGDGTVDVRERKSFPEESSFQGIRGFSTPTDEGDYLVWKDVEVDGNENVLAQTLLPQDAVDAVEDGIMPIPVDISFQYFLDGKKVNVEDIVGESGHFKMEVTFKNTSEERRTVQVPDKDTGEMMDAEVDTYLPLIIAPYDWYFDNNVFYNLEADAMALIFPLPDSYQVAWSFPLFPPATADMHTIFVEADVKNFHMPNLTIPVAFVFPVSNQTDLVSSFKTGFEGLYEGVNQLKDGLQQEVVDKGLGSAGTPDTLIYGIAAVDSGLQEMNAGIPQMKTPLDEDVIPGMDTIAGILGDFTAGFELLESYLGSSDTDGTLLYAMDQILSGFDSILLGANLIETPSALGGSIYTDLETIKGLAVQLNNDYGPDIRIGDIYDLADALQKVITTNTYSINDVANQIIAGIGSRTTDDSLLYAADQVNLYLNTLKAAFGSSAVEESFIGGSIAMKEGVNQLNAGLELLSGGLGDVQTGIGSPGTPDTLLYGSNAVLEGLNDMKSGLQQDIINEGLQVMGESLGATVNFLNVSSAQVEAIQQRGEEFNYFLAQPESGNNVDSESMVRFIFQVKPVYDYENGNSWITALILSIVIGLLLIGGGILLASRFT
jgi:putative membrane protein